MLRVQRKHLASPWQTTRSSAGIAGGPASATLASSSRAARRTSADHCHGHSWTGSASCQRLSATPSARAVACGSSVSSMAFVPAKARVCRNSSPACAPCPRTFLDGQPARRRGHPFGVARRIELGMRRPDLHILFVRATGSDPPDGAADLVAPHALHGSARGQVCDQLRNCPGMRGCSRRRHPVAAGAITHVLEHTTGTLDDRRRPEVAVVAGHQSLLHAAVTQDVQSGAHQPGRDEVHR